MNFLNMDAKNVEYSDKFKLQIFKLYSYPSMVKLAKVGSY